ncbi:hypothetical protein G9C98_002753 [Cotesia typhae]|uniref:Uncharacterized protein n=1 Tax=Cotesia typhae TaxID=2053667 RepID=A0A8J5UXH1_9HYME|nr:hypothetical protein G9C98_002753 [Cotesia typhae]
MKMIIALFALVAVAVAAPQGEVTVVKSYENDNTGFDNYRYSYELSDGQQKEESGELRTVPGAESPFYVVRGSYTWRDQEGRAYTVTYIADENGFQPNGEHLPK